MRPKYNYCSLLFRKNHLKRRVICIEACQNIQTMKKELIIISLAVLLPAGAAAQQVLTLEDCRTMAIQANKDIEQARMKVEMASYDRKIAAANYYPKVQAFGTVQYISGDFSLLGEDTMPQLGDAGTRAQAAYRQKMQQMQDMIFSDPALLAELMGSKMWQTVFMQMQNVDVSNALNAIGSQVDGTIEQVSHPEVSPVIVGVVSVQQPVFAGGKIIAANRMAAAAEELAREQYDGSYSEILVTVDQAYWQVVSLEAKKRLAENYADLLEQMEHDVEVSIGEGVATEADALKIRVKANEARMMRTRAVNGLTLSKMLLCKQTGLPLDTDIVLADESLDAIPLPVDSHDKSMEQILADRNETRQLELASRIYDEKVAIARADMLPTVALTANYIAMVPNLSDGFTRDFGGGRFTGGVVVKVPIFHGTEALQKTRKAQAEATIYRTKYDDACNLVNLQVSQLRKARGEALDRLAMAESNLSSAEENLRTATVGFEEGIVDSNTALAAQTAWLQAHSEYIDAGIELQINNSNLLRAEGSYISDIDGQ